MKKLAIQPTVIATILLVTVFLLTSCNTQPKNTLPKTVTDESSVIKTEDGYSYRDLNKNGKMDVYEDSRQPIEARVKNLLSQMTIEEKAGMMFINGARVNDDGSIEDKPATGMFAFAPNALKVMNEKKMNHFNLWAIPSIECAGKMVQCMQRYAEDSTRLGIPITIASDPRNHFSSTIFSLAPKNFRSGVSHWVSQPSVMKTDKMNLQIIHGRNTWL